MADQLITTLRKLFDCFRENGATETNGNADEHGQFDVQPITHGLKVWKIFFWPSVQSL
jgi:hypothetical protein